MLRFRKRQTVQVVVEVPAYSVEHRATAGYRIVSAAGIPVDSHTSYAAADYFARLLNAGTARIDMHACVGSKVVAL